jgi:hypothetical protein
MAFIYSLSLLMRYVSWNVRTSNGQLNISIQQKKERSSISTMCSLFPDKTHGDTVTLTVSVLCFYLSMMEWNHGNTVQVPSHYKFQKRKKKKKVKWEEHCKYYNSIKYEARRKSCKNTSYRTRQPTYSASIPTKEKKRKTDQACRHVLLPITSHPISETQSKLAVSPSEQSRG